ncbi:sigma-70 family RNA polymerase sigma factor [Aeoliella mucimassa]|uniref:RNA polymerase sigma factor n=1 Tax=Aeoliella mucimassa TaxID=2527972 RepID=A0A518AN07_9BACT|nr:sigma-70 family RNA polymerase sigma factor [Aeoliella mucimassa]QDU56103.1 RNA polymerase sigma factor [Aeoliella mucimassa]
MPDEQIPPDGPIQASEAFVQLLTGEQFRLLHYITMLLGDVDSAQNVLQETNIVLWRKSTDFEPGTNFSAWARKVAYWKVQSFLRDQQRERHVFGDALIARLANQETTSEQEIETRVALRDCMTKVSDENIGLLRDRYANGLSISALAAKLGRTESAIKVHLMRLRRLLQDCIERNLARELE